MTSKFFVLVFSWMAMTANAEILPTKSTRAETVTTCYQSRYENGVFVAFDIPFFQISYPEKGLALLHLNGPNIYKYQVGNEEVNPGEVADRRILAIAKNPIPCPVSGSVPGAPNISCNFSDRYEVSVYKRDDQIYSWFFIGNSGYSYGPSLRCWNDGPHSMMRGDSEVGVENSPTFTDTDRKECRSDGDCPPHYGCEVNYHYCTYIPGGW